MRICQICNGFPPFVGGTETHNYSLVKYLLEQGHEVDVLVRRPSMSIHIEDDVPRNGRIDILARGGNDCNPSVPVEYFESSIPFVEYLLLRYTIWRHERQTGSYDVVDVHSISHIPALIGKRSVLLSLHFYELSCPKSAPVPCEKANRAGECRKCVGAFRLAYWKILKMLALKIPQRIMVKYDFLRKQTEIAGASSHKMRIVPHWVDSSLLSAPPASNNLPAKRAAFNEELFTFGVLGRLDSFKGLMMILEAHAMLIKQKMFCGLVLIGDGELKDALKKKAIDLATESYVVFLGRIDHESVPSIISQIDAFVFGSAYDNYNWSLLEVMGSKKPVIATAMGGTKDIISDGYNGLLCDPTPESLASIMGFALRNHDLLEQISINAYATVAQRHGMNNLGLYEDIIREIALVNNTPGKEGQSKEIR